METVKITKRQMFEGFKKAAKTGVWDFDVDTVCEFCDKEIDALDRKAAKAKERAALKKQEGDELSAEIYGLLTDEFKTIVEVMDALGQEDLTHAKVARKLSDLQKAGKAEKTEITIPAQDGGKTRKVVAYRLASEE